ncbi:hypothetical protein HBI79_162970 [Parastagonospora nodorum]|nr:hypothetical protein HBI79_162970 [Parastagonospora nodorum]
MARPKSNFQAKASGTPQAKPTAGSKRKEPPTAARPRLDKKSKAVKDTTGRRKNFNVPVELPDLKHLGLEIPGLTLDLEDLGITIDHTTVNTTRFLKLVQDTGLTVNTIRKYTPPTSEARHVLELPLYDADMRLYQLDTESVALVDCTQPDGTTARCWQMTATNIHGAEPNKPIELYQIHIRNIKIFRNSRPVVTTCPNCTKDGLQATCDRMHPCGTCVDAGRGDKCKKEMDKRIAKQTKGNLARKVAYAKKHANLPRWNMLTDSVCKDRDQILKLGEITVNIMNRVPMDLEIDQWYANQGAPLARSFIIVTSLMHWKDHNYPQLDLATLSPGADLWSSSGLKGCSPWIPSPLTPPSLAILWECRLAPPYIHPTDDGATSSQLRGSDVDASVVSSMPYSTGWHLFGAEPVEGAPDELRTMRYVKLKNEEERVSIKAMQILLHDMVGMVGSSRALANYFQNRSRSLLKSSKGISDVVRKRTVARGTYEGPYDGKQILSLRKRGSRFEFFICKAALVDLDLDGFGPDFKDSSGEWNFTMLGVKFGATTLVHDQVCHAWVFEECLRALARGETLLNTLLLVHVAIDRIELGLLTRKQILANYCMCESPDAQQCTEHVCIVCKANWTCADMVRRIDQDGLLVTCAGCAGVNAGELKKSHASLDLLAQLKVNVTTLYRNERRFLGSAPIWTIEELSNVLRNNHSTDDPYSWTRGYAPSHNVSLKVRSGLLLGTNRSAWLGSEPYSLSIEKPHGRWLRSDLKVSLHDVENITLELFSINLLKSKDPVSSLPLYKEALELSERVAGRPPCVGYYPEVRKTWAIIERAYDNQRFITLFVPQRNKDRVLDQTPDVIRRAIEMERSGVWDGTLPDSFSTRALKRIFSTRADNPKFLKNTDGTHKFAMNDEYWDWILIQRLINELENDRSQGGFNQHGLKFPRLGKNKLPWFWRIDHCPNDIDEAWFFREFSSRLHTMSTLCDSHHATEESPATLLLECAVQFLENGGKDHLFGFVMTPCRGHTSTYSFGRGVTRKLNDGGDKTIHPGDHLKTGCKVLLPTSMKKDYDITRCTLIIECWPTNRFRYRFGGGPALIPVLKKAVSSIEPTKWYKQMKSSIEDYMAVPLPDSYKRRDAWAARIRSLDPRRTTQQPDDGDATDDEDAFFLDDEQLFLAEQLAGLSAMKTAAPEDPVECHECGEIGDKSTLLACTTKGHTERLTHYHCLGLDRMPTDTVAWPCKECEGESRPSHMFLNLKNIGNTCWMSSSIQCVYAIDSMRNLIMDASKELGKGHGDSGRDTRAWLPSIPQSRGADIASISSSHMQNVQEFLSKLRALFSKLGDASQAMRTDDIRRFFNALSSLHPSEWVLGQQNDSAELMSFVIMCLVMITDASDITYRQLSDESKKKEIRERGLLCELDGKYFDDRVKVSCCGFNYCRRCLEHYLDEHDQKCPNSDCTGSSSTAQSISHLSSDAIACAAKLPGLAEAAVSEHIDFMRQGYESEVHNAFCLQSVMESQCQEPGCALISRMFTCDHQMLLDFQDPNSDLNSLSGMMKNWLKTEVDSSIHCVSGCRAHAGSRVQHRRITLCSEYIFIRFQRGGISDRVLCGVDVPTFLDMSSIADLAGLPSDPGQPVRLGIRPIYQLFAVNIFYPQGRGGHYVTYIRKNDVWRSFDDLGPDIATAEHPQVAINKGGVVYYVLYQRLPQLMLPVDDKNQQTSGHVLRKGAHVPSEIEPSVFWQDVCTCEGCDDTFGSETTLLTHQVACMKYQIRIAVVAEREKMEMKFRDEAVQEEKRLKLSLIETMRVVMDAEDKKAALQTEMDNLVKRVNEIDAEMYMVDM